MPFWLCQSWCRPVSAFVPSLRACYCQHCSPPIGAFCHVLCAAKANSGSACTDLHAPKHCMSACPDKPHFRPSKESRGAASGVSIPDSPRPAPCVLRMTAAQVLPNGAESLSIACPPQALHHSRHFACAEGREGRWSRIVLSCQSHACVCEAVSWLTVNACSFIGSTFLVCLLDAQTQGSMGYVHA